MVPSRGSERIEAFSDAVFAIAITLLVLEIRVPETEAGGRLLDVLPQIVPSVIAYATSFIVVGAFWTNHHETFRYIERSDTTFLALNVLYLMFIAFIPFSAALLARYLGHPGDDTVAMVAYTFVLVMCSVAFNGLWWYASAGGRLTDASVGREEIQRHTSWVRRGLLLAIPAFALAFVSVPLCIVLYVAVFLVYFIPGLGQVKHRVVHRA
jgi:uncharacterized membrane protein